MATQQDLVRLLTGISDTQQPVQPTPVAGSKNFAGMFGAQQAAKLSGGIQNLARGGKPSPQQNIASAISGIDLKSSDGLRTMAKVKQIQGDIEGANALNKQALDLENLEPQAKAVADNLPAEYSALKDAIMANVSGALQKGIDIIGALPKTTDLKVKYLVDPVTQKTLGNVYQRGAHLYNSKNERIDLTADVTDKGLVIADTFLKPASSLVSTAPSEAAVRAELESAMTLEKFKDMSKDLIERGALTKESYDKFMPVYQKLEELEQSGVVGEGGAGTEFFASATNYITTALQILDPSYKVPAGASGQALYETQAKLLKAKMTEMTKGAISDRENAEHNKYTTSVNMPKAVRMGKINMDKATLQSAMNKVNAEEQWFEKYNTTVGFNAAWSRYAEDFPRTAGATLRNVTVNGKTEKKLVDNFEMVEDNMRLFDRLYLGKKTSGSPVFTDGEKQTSLEEVRNSLEKSKLDALMTAQSATKPTEIMIADSKRFARKNIGAAIIRKLDTGGWRVSK